MIGETIKEFKLTRRLGKGGMGEVWEAEQQIVHTRVAIKLLLADISSDTLPILAILRGEDEEEDDEEEVDS